MALKLAIFLASLVLGVINGAPSSNSSSVAHKRIINGVDVDIAEVPYQVSLQKRGHHVCGGSIIAPNYILTAAHCTDLFWKLKDASIRVNSTFRDEGGTVVSIDQIFVHPRYDFRQGDSIHDVAVLRLSKKLKYGPGVQPIKLPASTAKLKIGEMAVVTGWGITETGHKSKKLKLVMVPIVPYDDCKKAYEQSKTSVLRVNVNMICAKYPKGGKDACSEDSGGPLVVNGTLYGITSWGESCGTREHPGVYVDLPKYVNYVKKHWLNKGEKTGELEQKEEVKQEEDYGKKDNGKDQGKDNGKDYGKDNGKDQGKDYGKDNGKDNGKDYGKDQGKDNGKDQGKDYGKDTGKDNGKDYGKDQGKDYGKKVADNDKKKETKHPKKKLAGTKPEA